MTIIEINYSLAYALAWCWYNRKTPKFSFFGHENCIKMTHINNHFYFIFNVSFTDRKFCNVPCALFTLVHLLNLFYYAFWRSRLQRPSVRYILFLNKPLSWKLFTDSCSCMVSYFSCWYKLVAYFLEPLHEILLDTRNLLWKTLI